MKELYILDNGNDTTSYALLENNELIEYYLENINKKSIEGNIYIGKTQNVLPGLESAFVNIGEKMNAFIHAKDILPKTDIVTDGPVKVPPITKLIKPGDPIIVEVKREAIDKKGPRLSTHINFPGRFIVLLPNSPFITVSSKIEDQKEKDRLKEMASSILPDGYGAIIRTSAQDCSKKELEKDIKYLLNKWSEISTITLDEYPKKIYDRNGIFEKILIDLANKTLDIIYTNSKELSKQIKTIFKQLDINIAVKYKEELEFENSIKKQISSIDNNKIWLKNGSFIVIDKTEALYAIDVNSGKYIGKKSVRETILDINIQAAKEICKQLRLRDISGIIIIDFIDMDNDEDKQKVIETMKNESKKDRSHVQIEEFTKLNLMELTRKHINSKK